MIDKNDEGISKGGPSDTAEEVALIRFLESRKPEDERICYDPYAVRFIRPETLAKLQQKPEAGTDLEKQKSTLFRGVANTVVARVRYFDDMVQKAAEDGLEQLVILGAGYDTRAYRMGCLKNVMVFEVDRPNTQELKKAEVADMLGALPNNVTFVPVELESEALGLSLRAGGFDPRKKSMFLMEGLLMYIQPSAVDRILRSIKSGTGEGSVVLFDYVTRIANPDSSVDRQAAQNLLKFIKDANEPMKFSLKEGEIYAYLTERGFRDIVDFGNKDYIERYFKGKNRDRELFGLVSFASARV